MDQPLIPVTNPQACSHITTPKLSFTITKHPEEIKPESRLLSRALSFHAHHWQMIPLSSDKSPACNVAAYLTKRQSPEAVEHLFRAITAPHLAVILGNVSRCLYAIESASDAHHSALCAYVRLVSPSALYSIKYKRKQGGLVLFTAKRPIYPHDCHHYRLLGDGHALPLPDGLDPPTVPLPVLVEIPALSGAPCLTFAPIPRPSAHAWSIMRCRTRYDTPAQADAALVRSLSASGIDGQEIERRVMLAPYPSALRKMLPEKRQAKISALIAANAAEPCPKVAEFARAVRAHRWTGRKGDSQRLIMSALVRIAQRVDSLTVSTSRTELSNLSTVRQRAISDHLDDLAQMGWLSRDMSSKYVITCLSCAKPPYLTGIEYIKVGGFAQNAHTEHRGLVEFRGLGRTPWQIYEILTTPASETDLVERTGKHRTTVTRALSKLESAGAVTRSESGQWSRVAGFDPCATAQALGVRHLGARRINQHAQQARANQAELRRLAALSPRPTSPRPEPPSP